MENWSEPPRLTYNAGTLKRILLIDHWPGVTGGSGTGLGSTLFKLAAAADARDRGFALDLLTTPEKAELLSGTPVFDHITTSSPGGPYDSAVLLGISIPLALPNVVPFTAQDRARYKVSPHLAFWRDFLARSLSYEPPQTSAKFPLVIREDECAQAARLLTTDVRWVGMATGTVSQLKRYHHWDQVAEQLLQRGAGVVLLSSDRIETPPQARLLNLTGNTSIRQLMAIVSQCAAVVGSDGLITNLALVLGRPTATLFGMISPESVVDPDQPARSPALHLVERGCPLQFCYPTLENYRTAPCPLEPNLPRDAEVRCMKFPPGRIADEVLRLMSRG